MVVNSVSTMYAQFHVMVSVGLLQGERVEPKDQNRVLSLRTYHVCLAELCVGMLHGYGADV